MSLSLPTTGAPPLDFAASGHLYATHRFHAYAARCPPPLVKWALSKYSVPSDVVLDPMVGSGTTLVEASLLGRRAWGADIDPLARLIAKVKATPVDPELIASARARAERILKADEQEDGWRPELPNLEKWFREDVSADLARIRVAIKTVGRRNRDLRDLLWVAFSSLIVARSSVANARDLVHSRHHARVWHEDPKAITRFLARLQQMEKAMRDYMRLLDGRTPSVELVGEDARYMPIGDGSVDCIFTSPPYVSALDYVRAHIFAVAWMSDALRTTAAEYRILGRQYVGTERAAFRDGGRTDAPPRIGIDEIDVVVAKLHVKHPRNAWIVSRYFTDMSQILQELARVTKVGGHVILVVCPSNIRKVRVPTHELFLEIARRGLCSETALEPVEVLERTISDRRRVMPYLESAFGPRMRTEYVLVFRRRGD